MSEVLVEITRTEMVKKDMTFPCYFGDEINSFKVLGVGPAQAIKLTFGGSDSPTYVGIEESSLYSAVKCPSITEKEYQERFGKVIAILSRSEVRNIKKFTTLKGRK